MISRFTAHSIALLLGVSSIQQLTVEVYFNGGKYTHHHVTAGAG